MSSMAIGWIVFALASGATLVGMFLRAFLPTDHLNPDSREIVKLAMGLIATTAGLVLGLLIASAKTSYDTQNNEIKQAAADAVLLDRLLAHYGAETDDARLTLRRALAAALEATWPPRGTRPVRLDVPGKRPPIEDIEDSIQALSPRDDGQRWCRWRALKIVVNLQRTRWLLFGGVGDSIPTPFLVVLVFWITVIFGIFGLFAPHNGTVVAVLLLSALSVSAAIFLIVELDRPFEGLLKIPSAPMRYAASQLGQ